MHSVMITVSLILLFAVGIIIGLLFCFVACPVGY